MCLLIYISTLGALEVEKDCSNDTDIIDHILYDTTVHYNRHKIPADPVIVRIELWIQEVTSVSEMTQDFEIGIYDLEFILLNCNVNFLIKQKQR